MINVKDKNQDRLVRHARVRNKISGTAERPRLNVYRSLKEIYAQIIDDTNGNTLVSASTREKAVARAKQKLKLQKLLAKQLQNAL